MIKAFKALLEVIKECWENRYRLWKLASYNLKVQNSETALGFLWNFINPALQIFVYWFVFAIGLRVASTKAGYPYIIWLIVGIIPWIFLSNSINTSMNSISSFSGVLKRMKFPVATVPIKSVLTQLMMFIMSMAIVFAVFFLNGYSVSIYCLNTIYYTIAAFINMCAFALLSSAISIVFKDFQKLMSTVVRLLFYLTPVLWEPGENLSAQLITILNLNPLAYIVTGFRNSILYNRSLMYNWHQGAYFWVATLVLLLAGSALHMKLRRKFMDVI